MSWFTDIAGKAEDFLNKIDQNAAIALNQPALEKNGTSPRKNSISIENGPSSINGTTSDNIISPPSIISHNETQIENRSGNAVNDSLPGQNTLINNGSSIIPNTGRSKPKPGMKKLGQATSNKKGSPNLDSNPVLTMESKTRNGSVSPKPKKSDEEDLMAFLNDSGQKELDENLVLKNAVANQAREIELLFKNNRKLQTENEALLKNIQNFNEEKAAQGRVAGIEAQIEKVEEDNLQLKTLIKDKDDEIENLKRSLDQTLAKLQQVEVLQETQNKLELVEMEKLKLGQSNEELRQQISTLISQLESSDTHTSSIKNSLNNLEAEFTSYKEKAKSILKQKDDLIISLQEFQGESRSAEDGHSHESPFLPELNALKSERDLLNAEISQSRATSDSLREENNRLEFELNSVRNMVVQLQRALATEKDNSSSLQEENLQFKHQVSVLQFEIEKEKSERRKLDELRLRNETEENQSARGSPFLEQRGSSNSNDNEDNLRTRITALSQSLLEKQGLINSLSADKQLLQIHVERLQDQMRQMNNEVSSNLSGFPQTVVSNQPLYLSESPWDSGMSTSLKRVYSTVDSLCCQAGVVLRRRPNLRLGFCAYIILLHFWVFFVLFHSFSHVEPTTEHLSSKGPGVGPSPI